MTSGSERGSGVVRRERIAVIGAGSWGTTLALLGVRAGQPTVLYVRDRTVAATMAGQRIHARLLPGVSIPDELEIVTDLGEACAGATIVVMAVPSQAMRQSARAIASLTTGSIVVSAAKGLELGSLKRMSDVVREELPPAIGARVCALSGPNLATEIAAGRPATTVIAGTDLRAAERVRDALLSPQFRCYTNGDLIGVEMGGALKNVIAIGAGIADGLDAGENAKAAFMTRGIAEIARLGVASGAQPLTFAGLTGLGDLIATCASPASRNHRVGAQLARGRPLDQILAESVQVAEGVTTTRAARDLARRLGVELPITEQTYAVLFEGKSPMAAIAAMMQRDAKHELAGILPGVD